MQVALPSLLFEYSVDDVFDRAEEYLALQQSLKVSVFALHLQHVYAHICIHAWVLIEQRENFAEIPHVDAAFVEKVLQTLRVNWNAFLLFEVHDQVRDSFLIDEGG